MKVEMKTLKATSKRKHANSSDQDEEIEWTKIDFLCFELIENAKKKLEAHKQS